MGVLRPSPGGVIKTPPNNDLLINLALAFASAFAFARLFAMASADRGSSEAALAAGGVNILGAPPVAGTAGSAVAAAACGAVGTVVAVVVAGSSSSSSGSSSSSSIHDSSGRVIVVDSSRK